jgi:hypothetical protein
MLQITDKKGIQMTFANGNTISIQFGRGNYCKNRNLLEQNEIGVFCPDAEIAIWDKHGNWHSFEGDVRVEGYCSADEVAKWIDFAANNSINQSK